MSLAWMPLYIGDYEADTQHLDCSEHGAYLKLIMHYWQHGSLPKDDKHLASIARASLEQWSTIRPIIQPLFAADWQHKRIDLERQVAIDKHKIRVESGRKGGLAKAQRGVACSSNATSNAISNNEALLYQSQYRESSSLHSESKDSSFRDSSTDQPLTCEAQGKRKSRKRRSEPGMVDKATEVWNTLAATYGLATVKVITDPREAAVRARARELVDCYDFQDPQSGFMAWATKIRTSPFLRGESGWKPNFDWAIKVGNFTKIMEGAYDYQENQHNGFNGYGFRGNHR